MAVEDDVDAALDDILGDVINEAEGDTKAKAVTDKAVDFTDPQFLSTSNPVWVAEGLSQQVIDILSEKGITHFTEVQGKAFKPVVAGRDVIGRSRTGTGKTLAFGLPAMTRLQRIAEEKGEVDSYGRRKRGRLPSMLILCPTRELARQVQEELEHVSKPLGLYTTVFHGGVSYDPQSRALRMGVDILVGTPGRVIDHINRGNLNLSELNTVVLDEADEMLNMGFADDVETILEGMGSANDEKTQCLLFSATTPPWVKEIGMNYQNDVISIDATGGNKARTATTVRHMAIQVPPGSDSKKTILEDIIAIEISKDLGTETKSDDHVEENAIAAAAKLKKEGSNSHTQQKIFGKTIVFTETKREADELVSGGVFKSLTAQALHGDVGQKQRDSTLNAFRAGAFNVLVATDVAARGIDIQNVDLVVQFSPPRDVDTYVHRSGRTGRAGNKGTSVLLFDPRQARDIVRIERSLGHGFKFNLAGPPSSEAALKAAAKTSAMACTGISDETAAFFLDSAKSLLENETPEEVVAKCLAAISRRSGQVESRSLLTGEVGLATIEMSNNQGRPVSPGDVMFTVSKLARMSRKEGDEFESNVGKIQCNHDRGVAVFDMHIDDAKKLIEFAQGVNAGGAEFRILVELELERGRNFGAGRGGGRGGRGGYGGRGGRGGRGNNRRYGNNGGGYRSGGRGGGRGGYRGNTRSSYGGGGGRSYGKSDSW